MAERKHLQFRVVGEDPRMASPPLFSNFVGIAHVGKEVQLEFMFLDLNQVAAKMESTSSTPGEPVLFEGKTVAKIVIPSWAFLQLKDHLASILKKLEIEESGGAEVKTVEHTAHGN